MFYHTYLMYLMYPVMCFNLYISLNENLAAKLYSEHLFSK